MPYGAYHYRLAAWGVHGCSAWALSGLCAAQAEAGPAGGRGGGGSKGFEGACGAESAAAATAALALGTVAATAAERQCEGPAAGVGLLRGGPGVVVGARGAAPAGDEARRLARAAAAAGAAVMVILPPGSGIGSGSGGGGARAEQADGVLISSGAGEAGRAPAAGPAGAVLLTANFAASQGQPGCAPASQKGAPHTPADPAAVAAAVMAGVTRWLWAAANSLLVVVLPLCVRLVPLPLLARARGVLHRAVLRAAGRRPAPAPRPPGAAGAAVVVPAVTWEDVAAPAAREDRPASGARAAVSFTAAGGAQAGPGLAGSAGIAAAGAAGGGRLDVKRGVSVPQLHAEAHAATPMPATAAADSPAPAATCSSAQRSGGGSEVGAAPLMRARVLSWPDVSAAAPDAGASFGTGGAGGWLEGEEALESVLGSEGLLGSRPPAAAQPPGERALLVETAAAARVDKKRCAAPGCGRAALLGRRRGVS
jgi:hypothetical protein